MNLTKVLLSSLTVAAVLSSCTKDNEDFVSNKDVVQLTASVQSGNYTKVGDQWTGNEKIGLFMIGENDFSIINAIDNKEYNVAVAGPLSAADLNEAKYPADGSKVRFIAYYPYDKDLTNKIYKVDLRKEGDNDLLYTEATQTYNKQQTEPVELKFKHKMAKLFLTVKKDDVTKEAATAVISRKATADFDLTTGVLSNPGNTASLNMTGSGSGLTALVIPGLDTQSKIVFTVDGKNYTWNLSDKTLTQGIQYNYTITLKDEATPLVEAKLISTIEGWVTESDDINVDQDKTPQVPETVYETPVFSGSLTQNSLISNAKLSVNYTNGNGTLVNVTTVVAGAAANGVTIAEQSVTLASGNGSFELPLSGTPTLSGQITFTVSVDGKTLPMVSASVDEQKQQVTPVYTSNLTTLPTNTSANPGGGTISISGGSYAVLKLGTSSATGKWTSDPIGVTKSKLKFYASAWSGKTGTLKITIAGGGLIGGEASKTINLVNFVTGTSSPYSVAANRPESTDLHEYELTGVTASTTIQFETLTAADGRAVLFGINVE